MHSEYHHQIKRHGLREVPKRPFPHEPNVKLLIAAKTKYAAVWAKEECIGWLANNITKQSAMKPLVTGGQAESLRVAPSNMPIPFLDLYILL